MSELENLTSKALAAAQGDFNVLSTGEKLAVALILNRHDWLADMDYTLAEALERVGAEWVALIPAAARALERTNLVLREAAQSAQEEVVIANYESTDVVDVTAELVTHGGAPGYRDVSLTFDIQRHGSAAKHPKHRLCFRLSPQDGATIAQHIRDVHRFAWDRRPEPLDVQPGECRPRWID